MKISKGVAENLNPQTRYAIEFYHGIPGCSGAWVNLNSDPIYHIVTDIRGWIDAGNPRSESELRRFGKRIDRRQISSIKEIDSTSKDERLINWSNAPTFDINDVAKKLVIVGAGASFDCSYNEKDVDPDWQSPMVNQLFDDRFSHIWKKYPGVKQLLPELQIEDDIEEYFQNEWKLIDEGYQPDTLKELINTQFYLMELMSEISGRVGGKPSSNYQVLARNARKAFRSNQEKTLWVSFNYDTLLEDSIWSTLGKPILGSSINELVSNDIGQIIIKPHGSSNWCHLTRGLNTEIDVDNSDISRIANEIYTYGYDYHEISKSMIDGEIVTLDESIAHWSNGNHAYFPALLIPYHSKDDFVLPNLHLEYLEHCLKNIEEILVIGWKGNETKFLETLKNRIGTKGIKLTVIDPEPEMVIDRLKSCIDIGEIIADKGRDADLGPKGFSYHVKTKTLNKFWST